MADPLKILVLQCGPDREAGVSRKSAAAISAALERGGHDVSLREVGPNDLSALQAQCDVIFPALHGSWGEGGPLQDLLHGLGISYVGSPPRAARMAMDKVATKRVIQRLNLFTPMWQILKKDDDVELDVPVVIKPIADGSSFGVKIVHDIDKLELARGDIQHEYNRIFAERFIPGREMTVGIIGTTALPPIWIRPATDYYDFDAKYDRDDTTYSFELDLHEDVVAGLQDAAWQVHKAVGARHLSRVDFIVDEESRLWVLEINTMPGFTDHSLVPKAAAHAGIPMDELCDRLVRMALEGD